MTPNDRALAYIRTYVPYLVGAGLTWLLVHTGIDFSGPVQVALIAFLVPLTQNAYYVLVRVIEIRMPWIGVLLGWSNSPQYAAVDNLWASLVRTLIPSLAGALVATVVALGLALDADTQSTLIVGLVALIQAAYYALARWIVSRWPATRFLLGTGAAPAYVAKHAA